MNGKRLLEKDNCVWLQTKEGSTKKLTNFVLQVVSQVEADETALRGVCTLARRQGDSHAV